MPGFVRAFQFVGELVVRILKVSLKPFQRLAGVQRAAPSGRCPQAAKYPVSIKKALKKGVSGEGKQEFSLPRLLIIGTSVSGAH